MKRIALAVLVCSLGAAGCAPATIRVYDQPGGEARVVPIVKHPDLDPRGEPAVCVFAWQGNHFMGELTALRDSGQFRSLLLLTEDHLDPDGCGVLMSIRQGGARTDASGTSFVDLYSPYGGERVLRAQSEGGPGYFGFARLAYYLKAELQEGRPLRARLEELKRTKPLIDEDKVEELADNEPLTWEQLISAVSDPDEKHLLESARNQQAAEDEKDDESESGGETESRDGAAEDASPSASAVNPWWSKP